MSVNRPVVLVPTRSRPHNLKAITEAWWKTGAFDVARLVFIADADDLQIDAYHAEVASPAELVVLPEWMPLVPKLNHQALEVAQESPAGTPIVFMGDDHLPRTERWAHMLAENHALRPELIWYGRDGFQDSNLPTWWSMDSRAVLALGRMVPAPVQHLYCDNVVLELGKAAHSIGYDERILIEHMHPVVGKAPSDEQYARVNRPEQYDRDRAAFQSWTRGALALDASILAGLGG